MLFAATLLITAMAICLAIFYIRHQWKTQAVKDDYRKRGIPYVALSNLISLLIFKKRMELERHEMIRRKGKIFGTAIFGSSNITFADPELVQQVLSKEFTHFPNRREFNTDDPIFENFLSVVELDKWKRLRTIVAPTFATGKMRRVKPCLDGICLTLLANIDTALGRGEDQLNLKQFAGAFTMDTVVQVAFGIKVDSLVDPNNPLILNAKKLFSTDMSWRNILAFALIFSMPKWVQKRLPRLTRLNADVLDKLSEFSIKIIEQKRREFAAKDFAKASNFIEFLLEAEHELELQEQKPKAQQNGDVSITNGVNNEGKKLVKYMTNDELISQCVLFFLAGYDTTATLITMACYYLALNPDKQQLAYESIEQVIKQELPKEETNDGKPVKNILERIPFEWYGGGGSGAGTKFEYITALTSETLRMTPPAPFLERRCMQDCTLNCSPGGPMSQVEVKRGEMIQIPVYSLHHDEEYFPEPHEFRPERFCKETMSDFPKYAYIPFGSGPRACVARSLALMEAHMALVWLIYNYRFVRCDKTTVPVQFYNNGGLLVPKDIHLKVERRAN